MGSYVIIVKNSKMLMGRNEVMSMWVFTEKF